MEVNEHPGSWPGCSLATQPLGATDLTVGSLSLSRTLVITSSSLEVTGAVPPPQPGGTRSAALFGEPSPAATLPSQLWSRKARLNCRGLTNTSSHSTFIRTPESSLLLPFGPSRCQAHPVRALLETLAVQSLKLLMGFQTGDKVHVWGLVSQGVRLRQVTGDPGQAAHCQAQLC